MATLLAGRRAWPDFLTLVRTVGDPITTAAQLHAGRGRVPARAVDARSPTVIQLASTIVAVVAVVVAARVATAEAAYLVAVVASQLLSPVLWDHYAMLLLLPVAYLLAAGAGGRWPSRS